MQGEKGKCNIEYSQRKDTGRHSRTPSEAGGLLKNRPPLYSRPGARPPHSGEGSCGGLSRKKSAEDVKKAPGKISLLSVNFDDISAKQAALGVIRAAEEKRGGYLVTPNALICSRAFSDESFAALINGALIVLPDGKGVRLGARLCKKRFSSEASSGVDTGELIARYSAERKIPVYFLGGRAGVAERAAANLKAKYPGLVVGGYHDGYSESDDEMISRILSTDSRIAYVCLGSPRQELFCRRLSLSGGIVCLALGGSLDIYSKNRKRAPRIFIAAGLEWLYRMLAEPRRFSALPSLAFFLASCAAPHTLGTAKAAQARRHSPKSAHRV